MPHDAAPMTAAPVGVGTAAGDGDRALVRGIQAALVAYAVWGLLTIYWKAIGDFDAVELIGWRVLSSAVIMAVVVTARHSWPTLLATLRTPRTLGFITFAALLLTGNWLAYVYAVVNDHVLETALGYLIAPLGTMALGIVVLGEVPSRLQYLAMALGAVAIVVLTLNYGEVPYAALAVAFTWTTYGLVKRRSALPAIDSFAAESFVLVVPAAIAVALLSGRAGSVVGSADTGQLVLVAFTGAVTAFPLVLFAVAAGRVPFTLLGPIQYLVPTINLILGWAVYHEDMPPARLVGFALVWVALALVTIDQVRRHRARPR